MRDKLYYATTHSYELLALLQDSPANRFFTYEAALTKLKALKKYPLCNQNKIQYDEETEMALWVKGYGIEESRKDGYFGNYIKIKIQDYLFKNKTFYKLSFEVIEIDKKYHPFKALPESMNNRMPNWGHPVLRAVKSLKEFDGKHEAQSFLERLVHEFPTAHPVPGLDGIRTFIFSRRVEIPAELTTAATNEIPDGTGTEDSIDTFDNTDIATITTNAEVTTTKNKLYKSWIFSVFQKENGKYYINYWENNYYDIKKFQFFNYGFSLME
jgi:hypothetical protein